MNVPPNGTVAYSKRPLSVAAGLPFSRPFVNQDPNGVGIDITGFAIAGQFEWTISGAPQSLAVTITLDPASPPTVGKFYASLSSEETQELLGAPAPTLHLQLTDLLGNVQAAIWPIDVRRP